MNGLDAIALLRAMRWTLPVIVITAFGDDDTLERARQLGAAAVLDKPFHLSDLREAVYGALAALDGEPPPSSVRAVRDDEDW